MGVAEFCDMSCRVGQPCPGGVVPWGPRPCELTADEALALIPPGQNVEADHERACRQLATEDVMNAVLSR